MSAFPLVLRGENLTIGSTNVADQVTSFVINGSRTTLPIPATFGNRVVGAALGDESWSVTINYMQGDGSDAYDTLSEIFFNALTDEVNAGTLNFSGSVSKETGADIYYGTFVVSEFSHGGDAETIGMASATFQMTGRPSRTLGS